MILDMADYAFNLILVFFSKTFQKLASCHQISPQSITTTGKRYSTGMMLPYRSHPKELYKGQVSDHEDTRCPEFFGGLHVAFTLLWCVKNTHLENY